MGEPNGGQDTLISGAQRLVIAQCEQLVDIYKDGSNSKASVIRYLYDCIRGPDSPVEDQFIESTLGTYVNMLDAIDRSRASGSTSNHEKGQVEGSAPQPERFQSRRSRPSSPGSKATSRAPSDQPAGGKRARPDASEFAWAAASAECELALHPESRETLRLLRVYSADIQYACENLLNSGIAPEFPLNEWTNVLLGRAIDLDHVFSEQFSFAAREPAKRISNMGDWILAWNRAAAAIKVAFPHRARELDLYLEHIIQMFGALAPSLQERVIRYDRAVRKRVAAARHFRLSDFADFADLRLMYISFVGAGVSGNRESAMAKPDRKRAKSEARQR